MIILGIDKEVTWGIELSCTVTKRANFCQEFSFRGENLYPVILHVSNKDVILSICRNSPRGFEETVTGPLAAKFADESPIAAKNLDSIIAVVADNDPTLGVDSDICWTVELPLSFPVGTKLRDVFPPGAEYLDPMIVAIGHVDVALFVDSNPEGRLKLAFFAAVLTESEERRPNVGIFSAIDDQHCEGTAHDWLVLDSNCYFMFAIHFWRVMDSVGTIPCNSKCDLYF